MKRHITLSSLLIFTLSFTPLFGQNIKTICGTGVAGYSGDGGPAVNATIDHAHEIHVDVLGNIYITDAYNNRIRKIDLTGTIVTIAGTGTQSYSGDGGPAISAELSRPLGVFVDGSGDVYITDWDNHRIRKITVATGTINTIVGTGVQGYAGDGGLATLAQLSDPTRVHVMSNGDMYISEFSNHTVRKVDGTTGIITTYAGNGTAGFSGDNGLANAAQLRFPREIYPDISGNLYICDSGNNRIRKVDATTGIITTVAGVGTNGTSGDGGTADTAELANPAGLHITPNGDIYFSEWAGHVVRKIDVVTGIINTIAGDTIPGYSGDGGPATAALLNGPFEIHIDGPGNILIADYLNNVIRSISPITGLEEESIHEGLSIYPNPTNGRLTIKNSTGLIRLIDLTGRVVLTQQATTATQQLDIFHLPNGIYQLQSGDHTERIVKQ